MEDYRKEIEILRQAFAQDRTDEEIEMPDAEAELASFMAAHRNRFERKTVRLIFIRKIAALFLGIVMLSCLAYAAVRTNFFTQPWSNDPKVEKAAVAEAVPATLLIVPNDTVQKPTGVVTFANHELVEILTDICNVYQVEVQFKYEEQKHIRLHFSYNTNDKIEDVTESLNTFEKFRLSLKSNKLTVD